MFVTFNNFTFFLKLRSVNTSLNEAELSLIAHNKMIALKQSTLIKYENQLSELKDQKVY